MLTICLTEKEVVLLQKSIKFCIKTCKNEKKKSHCYSCESLEEILKKLS